MERFIFKALKDFENGKMSRRQLIQTITIAAATFGAGEEAANAAPADGFKTVGVNHISYACPDYTKARDFYSMLMGMENLPDKDSGTQAYLAFGPHEGGCWLLPRGYEDTSSPNPIAAPRGGQRAGNAPAGGRGGAATNNGPQDPPVAAVIDHLAFTVANFDKERTLALLKDWGLKHQGPDGTPRPDGDSYHVWDPFGYDLQISGNGMGAGPQRGGEE
jgi:catechol 2,3-dioxygenase-like lactoylglutathione lyase family enzyme